MILVNVGRVYLFCQSKKTELPRTLNRCICPQKNERQQRKLVRDGMRDKKKGRTRISEYPNTKLWRKKLYQRMSAVSRT